MRPRFAQDSLGTLDKRAKREKGNDNRSGRKSASRGANQSGRNNRESAKIAVHGPCVFNDLGGNCSHVIDSLASYSYPCQP